MGFDFTILSYFLQQAGFCSIQRVASFNLFPDTSDLHYKGKAISLNVVARKCRISQTQGRDSDEGEEVYAVDHNANTWYEGMEAWKKED